MKYWFEAKMESTDKPIRCSICGIFQMQPSRLFVEHKLVSGNIADPSYPSFKETGRNMCLDCAKDGLL